jgi:hypothetical protein
VTRSKPFDCGAVAAMASRMGLVRRVMQMQRVRGGHGGGGSWFAPGTQEGPNGVLFGETPPPPGQKRKWEDWEAPYYITGVLTTLMLTVGLTAKPDTRIETWAHKQALERLAAEEEAEAS